MHDIAKSRQTLSERRRQFRESVEERRAILLPGTANALVARIIEDLGFEAIYLSGAGFANTELGIPDVGLVTMTEIAEAAFRVSDICSLPLVVDIDTGFGNAVNVYRTVKTLERAGAAALQIEDQVFPKKCGHFEGKAIIPLSEMLSKVKAAVDARTDDNLMIIGRTDARAVEGMAAAVDRAAAMREAGADILFVEAPVGADELAEIAALPGPQVANIVFGGRTPMLARSELQDMGFSLILYANAALQTTIRSVSSVLGHLRDKGSLMDVEGQLAGFEERQRVVHKAHFDALEKHYAVS